VRDRALPAEAALYMPGFRLSPRPRAVFNAWIDAQRMGRERNAILHPTYYRDPATLPSRPVVVTVYDMAHERFPSFFQRRWWNSEDPARWKRAIVDRADRLVCISESTRRDLIEFLGTEEKKTRVIHCGATDWSGITSEEVPGIGSPFYLWVGERHSYKNFAPTLFSWAASGAPRMTSMLCVGGGPLTSAEMELARGLRVVDKLKQRTLSDAKLKWAYEHAVALLYTSKCEGFGLPILEAMSRGCPVVASSVSSMPEVGGDAAVYADPTDPESMGSAIQRVYTEGRGDTIAARLRARAAEFSWDRAAREHEALYRELD
jgi:glycosyltransferase involved in cell wall biosynthesis